MIFPMPESGESLLGFLKKLFGYCVTDVATSGNVTAEITGGVLSINVPPTPINKPFYAKITGSSGAAYAWTEQIVSGGLTLIDKPGGRSGTTSTNPLRELNGVTGIANNTYVQAYGVGTTSNAIVYVFEYVGLINPAATFAVKVQQTGGSNGTDTTTATYTYTVRTLPWNGTSGGETLGTNVPVSRPRPNGLMTVQAGSTGYGLAFRDGSTLILWDAGEVPDTTVDCEETP